MNGSAALEGATDALAENDETDENTTRKRAKTKPLKHI
jgi:hypothetical protein